MKKRFLLCLVLVSCLPLQAVAAEDTGLDYFQDEEPLAESPKPQPVVKKQVPAAAAVESADEDLAEPAEAPVKAAVEVPKPKAPAIQAYEESYKEAAAEENLPEDNSFEEPLAPEPEIPKAEIAELKVPDVEVKKPRVKEPEPAPAPKAIKAEAPKEAPKPNIYAEQFFLRPDERLKYKTSDIGGLVFIQAPDRSRNTQYAVVTDFAPNVIRSRFVPGLQSLEDAQKWVKENIETADYHGVALKRIAVPTDDGHSKMIYWVGHKAFESAEEAQAQVATIETVAEKQGGNFQEMVREADKAYTPVEVQPMTAERKAQFQKEEEIVLRLFDQLDIGNELFGPFQGSPQGEPIVWQSFGETSFRLNNFESSHFNSQVGFWTNRVVLKGIRAPLNTIDPFVEFTPSLESNGVGFKQNLKVLTGLEWRPFAANPWLSNFQVGSLHLLDFVKSYRFFTAYATRYGLKGDITGSPNHNLISGINAFYEWGVDLPAVSELEPTSFDDYIRLYTWGEYFGNYTFETTGFAAEDDFDAFILNSSILLGVKLPGIPLPSNPINDQLVLMPYVKYEHVNNSEFAFSFQNRHFVGAGLRWMPFRDYRWKDNEWLYKIKIFAEYDGIGSAYNTKVGDGGDSTSPNDWDFRVGVNFSSRRY